MISMAELSYLRYLRVHGLVYKALWIDTRNHEARQRLARQQRNDIISLKKTSDEKLDKCLDFYKETAKQTYYINVL